MSEEQEESEEKFVVLPSDGAALKLDPESRCVENVRGDSFFFFPNPFHLIRERNCGVIFFGQF